MDAAKRHGSLDVFASLNAVTGEFQHTDPSDLVPRTTNPQLSRAHHPSLTRTGDVNDLAHCIAICYAYRMAQLVTRIDDELAAEVDELVSVGAATSRSDAVRQSLRILIDQYHRDRTAEAIVQGYRRHAQTAEEVGWADKATIAMIADEPW